MRPETRLRCAMFGLAVGVMALIPKAHFDILTNSDKAFFCAAFAVLTVGALWPSRDS